VSWLQLPSFGGAMFSLVSFHLLFCSVFCFGRCFATEIRGFALVVDVCESSESSRAYGSASRVWQGIHCFLSDLSIPEKTTAEVFEESFQDAHFCGIFLSSD